MPQPTVTPGQPRIITLALCDSLGRVLAIATGRLAAKTDQ
jgi:hypothetical protein